MCANKYEQAADNGGGGRENNGQVLQMGCDLADTQRSTEATYLEELQLHIWTSCQGYIQPAGSGVMIYVLCIYGIVS